MSLLDFFRPNRNVNLTDPKGWTGWSMLVGGRRSLSGQTISVDSALQLSAFWSCVRLLAETVGTLPVAVYSRSPDGSKQIAADHYLYNLVHEAPNAEQTACEFWEGVTLCLCLWGNAYARLIRRNFGDVTAMQLLRPDLMTLRRDENGVLRYTYQAYGQVEEISEDDIMHVRGFGFGGELGLSPLSYARKTLGISLASEEASEVMFANGLRPSGYIKFAQMLTGEQRALFKQNVASEFGGTGNTGKTMLLEGGMEYQQLSINPQDAQFLEQRGFGIEEICRWFRVPPHMVGHTSKSTSWGHGIEQQNIEFLTYTLRPYLGRIEQAARRALIPAGKRKDLFIEFNAEGLLRADSTARAALYSQMTQNGVYSRNECRARENLPPVDGGDQLTVQSNLVPLDKLGTQAPAPTPPNPDSSTAKAGFSWQTAEAIAQVDPLGAIRYVRAHEVIAA